MPMDNLRKTVRKLAAGLPFVTLAPVLRADGDAPRFLPSLQAALASRGAGQGGDAVPRRHVVEAGVDIEGGCL
jgi:hypothetical protein